MAYNYEYPYVNTDLYNDDWLINKVRELAEEWKSLKKSWSDYKTELDALIEYIKNYFKNLNVQNEVNKKIDSMVTSGEMANILAPIVEPVYEEINALKSRMSNFESLPPGTGTGQAELEAARINFQGYSFNTAGDAVRETDRYLNVINEQDWAVKGIVKNILTLGMIGYNLTNTFPFYTPSSLDIISDYISTAGRTYIDIGGMFRGAGYWVNFYDSGKKYLGRYEINQGDDLEDGFFRYNLVGYDVAYVRISNTSEFWYQIKVRTATGIYGGSEKFELTNLAQGFKYRYMYDSGDLTEVFRLGGTIILGPGTYTLQTGITLPENTHIKGCGRDVNIQIRGDGECIRVQHTSTIENVRLSGIGNEANKNVVAVRVVGRNTRIRDVYIDSVKYGLLYDSVYSEERGQSSVVSGCTIIVCSQAALRLGVRAEFIAFSDCEFSNSHNGIECVGGNNLFTNCKITNNENGLVMDKQINDSHGSFVGCTFAHNSDRTININGIDNGEIFSACSIFYGTVFVSNAKGVVFNGCNFGSVTLNMTNGYIYNSMYTNTKMIFDPEVITDNFYHI